jgi:hypothetical protein
MTAYPLFPTISPFAWHLKWYLLPTFRFAWFLAFAAGYHLQGLVSPEVPRIVQLRGFLSSSAAVANWEKERQRSTAEVERAKIFMMCVMMSTFLGFG